MILKTIEHIIKNVKIDKIIGNTNKKITSIELDSRSIINGSLFAAIKGNAADGHNYIEAAIQKGASTILCEDFPETINNQITYIKVKDSNYSLGIIACNFYNNPSQNINLIGVTGTNGKTTTATLLYNLFTELGYKCGLISTVRINIANSSKPSKLTTPDTIEINKNLSLMVESGCDYCFMEVSSHSVVQNRIAGLKFKGAVFTNLTLDHLDYHQTFKSYIEAKKRFFDNLGHDSFALTNIDDKNGLTMLQNTKAQQFTYSMKRVADFSARILESRIDGTLLSINNSEIWCQLVGGFNAYNLLCIYATALLLGINKNGCLTILSKLKPVEGRFQQIKLGNGIIGIVDYAHTPDALQNVLYTIAKLIKGRGNIITVVGAGGNRDKTKRPIMGSIASQFSFKTILTSDNPRFELPTQIIDDMYAGVEVEKQNSVLKITDRSEAIKTACMLAKSGDIILVAGKGHETYQEINGERNHFDDREKLNEFYKPVNQ